MPVALPFTPTIVAAESRLVARAIATGGKAVPGGYVTRAGTYMRASGTRMTAAEVRSAQGLEPLPKPTSGPGSGETRTTTKAPAGKGPAVAETKSKLETAALSAAEKKACEEAGIDTSFADKARELLRKVKGSKYTKIGAAGTAAAGAATAALKKSGAAVPDLENMTAAEIADMAAGNDEFVEAAQEAGAGREAQTLRRIGQGRQDDIANIERSQVEADALYAEAMAAKYAVKAAKARSVLK